MAEYFRDDEHRDVLLLIDNIFRFIQAGMEVSGLMGQMPSRLGYQPTMGTELSRPGRAHRQHRYRRHYLDSGGVRAGGRFHRSGGGAYVFASFRVHRAVAQARERGPLSGHRPVAIQFQDGHARASSANGITLLAQEIRRTLAQYAELKDIIAMLGLEQLSPEDRKVVGRARRLERFLTQPFFTTEQFTGLKGKLVSLKDALDGCERILRDEFKDYPESALYMIGAIAEAKAAAEAGQPASPAKAAPEPQPRPKAQAQAKPEHAASTHES